MSRPWMPPHRLPFARSQSALLDALMLHDMSSQSGRSPERPWDRQQAPILQGVAGRREVKRNGAIVQENSTLLLCYSHLAAFAQHLKGPARFQETPGTPSERWERQPLLVGVLFETVHQLTQVVASIAKSCPEHYANISFFARRLCLADLGKVIKS
jgi:hypothetical protein